MNRFLSFRLVATLLLLTGARLVAVLAERRVPEHLALPLDSIENQISGWSAAKSERLDEGVLRQLDPTSYISRQYRKGASQLDLFIAYYAQQRAGESMHSPKHCLPGGGWEIWKHGSAPITVNGNDVHVNKYFIQNSGHRLLMFYWYQSRNRIIASEYIGKLMLARDTLLTGRTAASIVRITLPDGPGATEEGIRFATELIPQVERCFAK
jgi:EpsI family protein